MPKSSEKRETWFQTSVRLTGKQAEQADAINDIKNNIGIAQILRDAFDFYVASKFPQLLK